MKKFIALFSIITIAILVFGAVGTAKGQGERGASLFKLNCAPCHPDGGNVLHPQKTLHKKDRETNGVMTASDIVGKMRNPGPDMSKFDEKTIPDKDAKEIAEYILKTFK